MRTRIRNFIFLFFFTLSAYAQEQEEGQQELIELKKRLDEIYTLLKKSDFATKHDVRHLERSFREDIRNHEGKITEQIENLKVTVEDLKTKVEEIEEVKRVTKEERKETQEQITSIRKQLNILKWVGVGIICLFFIITIVTGRGRRRRTLKL